MDPFILLLIAGGAAAFTIANKGRAHARWKPILEDAATKLGGRVSTGNIFDAPELRADVDGSTVTVELKNVHKSIKKAAAVAQVALPDGLSGVRLYFGWDVGSVPKELEYITEIPFPHSFGLGGRVVVRADDAAIANRFGERIVADLSDLKRESNARAIEVLARGGTLKLAAHGMKETAWAVERLVRIAVRLARLVDQAVRGTALPSGAVSGERTGPSPLASTPGASFAGSGAPSPVKEPDAGDTAPVRPAGRGESDGGGTAVGSSGSASSGSGSSGSGSEESTEETACALCGDLRKRGNKTQAWVRCKRCKSPYHHGCWLQATGCVAEGCTETRSVPFP